MCEVHRMRKAREGRSAIMHAVENMVYERWREVTARIRGEA